MFKVFEVNLRRRQPEPEPIEPTELPTSPCPHPVGSPERVETYRRRVELGQHLYHPSDSRVILVR